jgi:hypothetical protein
MNYKHNAAAGQLPRLRAHYVTGGNSARTMASFAMQPRSAGVYSIDREGGGPLDAPEQLPAGSCNSTDVRTGPWHLNDGNGQAAPAQSFVARMLEC